MDSVGVLPNHLMWHRIRGEGDELVTPVECQVLSQAMLQLSAPQGASEGPGTSCVH